MFVIFKSDVIIHTVWGNESIFLLSRQCPLWTTSFPKVCALCARMFACVWTCVHVRSYGLPFLRINNSWNNASGKVQKVVKRYLYRFLQFSHKSNVQKISAYSCPENVRFNSFVFQHISNGTLISSIFQQWFAWNTVGNTFCFAVRSVI